MSINIGTVSGNTNTVNVVSLDTSATALAAGGRTLSLNFLGGTLQGSNATIRFEAAKNASGGRNFDVTVTVVGGPAGPITVDTAGSSANVTGFDIVSRTNSFDIIVHLELSNDAPSALIVLNLHNLPVEIPALSGSAEYSRVTGPFDILPPINWSVARTVV